jgi:hypothetical protein
MLDLMLGNSPEAFSCGEIYALFRPFQKHHFDPVCRCGAENCAIWAQLKHVPERNFHKQALQQPGIRYVVDSSKDLRWVLDSNIWAQGRNYRIHNVLIWKEPMELAFSHWQRGQPIDFFREQFLVYYNRFLSLNLPFLSVSYNKLRTDSRNVLQQVCNALGMEYTDGREEFWHKHHHHFFGNAGTASQVKKGESRVRAQTEYPDKFIAEYENLLSSTGPDVEIQQVIDQLRSCEVGHPTMSDRRPFSPSLIRPGWYYRHMLKAVFRRNFPAPPPTVFHKS